MASKSMIKQQSQRLFYNFLLGLMIFSLANANISQTVNCEQEWQKELFYNPDPFTVTGTATRKLAPEVVSIQPSIETLEKDASISLQKNQEIIQKAIQSVKQNHKVLESEIKTNGFTISPVYKSVFDQRSQNYNSVFEGYQTSNSILIRTSQLNLTGQIIDTLIKAGMNRVNSVEFDIKSETRNKIMDELIAEAIQDAKKQAKLALDELGLEIKSVKNINIINNQAPPVYNYAYAKNTESFAADTSSGGADTIFSSNLTLKKQVTITFLIGKK